MSEIITAVFVDGVLRPLNFLSLQEGATVRLQVLPEDSASEALQVIQSLVAAGLITPPPHRDGIEPVSEEAWRDLTQKLSPGRGDNSKLLSSLKFPTDEC